ncbi:MAG: hypothetical protein FD177_1433 [Desulfovibrionaceae bacterium]|nr:MAG: hypothetical protein FD177_1433 [Desulfovibrionaceae bacterium]
MKTMDIAQARILPVFMLMTCPLRSVKNLVAHPVAGGLPRFRHSLRNGCDPASHQTEFGYRMRPTSDRAQVAA